MFREHWDVTNGVCVGQLYSFLTSWLGKSFSQERKKNMSFGWAVFRERKTDLLYRLATYVYLLYYVREALSCGVHVFRCWVVPSDEQGNCSLFYCHKYYCRHSHTLFSYADAHLIGITSGRVLFCPFFYSVGLYSSVTFLISDAPRNAEEWKSSLSQGDFLRNLSSDNKKQWSSSFGRSGGPDEEKMVSKVSKYFNCLDMAGRKVAPEFQF